MDNQQLLIVGASALLSGGIASAVLPSQSFVPVAASTATGLGATILVKKREQEVAKNALESSNSTTNYVAELEHLIKGNHHEFIAFKAQITQEKISWESEITALRNKLSQWESKSDSLNNLPLTPIIEVPQLKTESTETTQNLTILDWLKSRNAEVNKYHQPETGDEAIHQISMFLGNNYSDLQKIYKHIKYQTKAGDDKLRFTFKDNDSKEYITTIKKFCELLSNNDLLKKYHPHNRIIYGNIRIENSNINLLDGLWLERFVEGAISNILQNNAICYQSLMNVQGSFSKATKYELDVLFLVKDNPILIECKTYVNEVELSKFSRKVHKLNIDPKDAFFITTELNQQANSTNYKPEFHLVDISNFRQAIADRLSLVYDKHLINNSSEILESSEAKANKQTPLTQPVDISTNTKLLTFLRKKTLRPLPEIRENVLREICSVSVNSQQPLTINQVTGKLAEILSLSKSSIDDILHAVVFAECFLNENREPIRSFNVPVFSLVSLEPAVLEQKCLESYASAVLSVNENYFASSDNVRNFEEITQGKAPLPDTIKMLIEKLIAKAEKSPNEQQE
jgi:hypothetical protein